MHGRYTLPASGALGAVASRWRPNVHAAIAILNKGLGLPHGKIARLNWLHVFVTEEVVLHRIDRQRGHEVPVEIIGLEYDAAR